jgi:hypothetical protein
MVSTLFHDWLGTQVHLTAVDSMGCKALRLVSGKQRSWFDSSLWHHLCLFVSRAAVNIKVGYLLSHGVEMVWTRDCFVLNS